MTIIIAVTSGNYTHTLDLSVIGQDRASNTSKLSWVYNIHRNTSAGDGAWAGSPGRTFTATIDGVADSETKTFDFRAYADLTTASGTMVVGHNADGTRAVGASIYGPGSSVSAGFSITSGSGALVLPTIVRNRAKAGVARRRGLRRHQQRMGARTALRRGRWRLARNLANVRGQARALPWRSLVASNSLRQCRHDL